MLVSIVIPCYQNEAEIENTVYKIDRLLTTASIPAEILLIDDGSTDETWSKIKLLADRFKFVRRFQLHRNIGAYNAVLVGFEKATGDAILVMAADGDDPPSLIPSMLSSLHSADAVLANRQDSEKGILTQLISRLFHSGLRILGAKNVPKGGSDFLVVKRHVLHAAMKSGFPAGNTLVHLIQFADRIETIGYTKGKSKPTSWSFIAKARLMVQTFNQFLPIPFVKTHPTEATVVSEC